MNVEAKTENYKSSMLAPEEKTGYGWDIASFSERMTKRLNKIRELVVENDDTSARSPSQEYVRQ